MTDNVTGKKQDIATRLNEIAQEFIDFVNYEFADLNNYFSDKVNKNVVNLLNVEKPKVMVYGIYNSGKSTLINSLCKEEVAEMADRPMTDRISEYDRGDYYLVDSPGVDAPIQHEEVTENYINKCHIILYVISSKGLFEDRKNYEKLANLVVKDIPFIIVLNDRGYPGGKDWDEERKKREKYAHEEELKTIQYKIIQNLIKVSNNQSIADNYEVVVLNAKKAWTGVIKEKPKLYEASGVEFLDRRIGQMLNNDTSITALFRQPISNLKECLNEIEKMITQTMSGNSTDDFGKRLYTMERKKDNIVQDMRILVKQAVQNHLDELTNSYVSGDDYYEAIANAIFMDIEERYSAKLNELFVYVDKNFKELELNIDRVSNLIFDITGKLKSRSVGKMGDSATVDEEPEMEELNFSKETVSFWDFLKSRKKREKEKRERLEHEAKVRNEYAQYKVQEMIRKKQEARQLASSDLDILNIEFNAIVSSGLDEKYDDLISQIQQIEDISKQVKEDGERQMGKIREYRKAISVIENSMS